MNKHIIAVSGNIGSGKTTLLKTIHKENSNGSILIIEPVDEWAKALKAFKASGSVKDQIALQRVVSNYAKTTYETIVSNPDKNVYIERTVQEHIDIFLDKDRIGVEAYNELLSFYKKWNYDELLTDVIKLDIPAEICYERVLKRGQHGDKGTTLEYLQYLEGRYKKHFSPKITSLVFSGNIGAGKTTTIDKVSKYLLECGTKVVTFRERVDLWGGLLEKFRKTRDPVDLVELQKAIALCAKDVYTSLKNPEKDTVYLIERSVKENIVVFIDPHLKSGFITKEQYDSIVSIWEEWNYDKYTSAIGRLDVKPEECYKRILSRGQPGDEGITLEYLQNLGSIYDSLINKGIWYKPRHGIPILNTIKELQVLSPSSVIVFTGNIGAGKSTEIKKLFYEYGDARAKALLEPVEEWGDDLSAFKKSGSVDDLIKLQKNISSFSKKVYKEITEGDYEFYLVERSNYEHIKIFCEPLLESGFINKEQFLEITKDYTDYNFDEFITKTEYLDVPHEECYKRILERGQPGDYTIEPEYIELLGKRYDNLYK